jgi:hypothetical protein
MPLKKTFIIKTGRAAQGRGKALGAGAAPGCPGKFSGAAPKPALGAEPGAAPDMKGGSQLLASQTRFKESRKPAGPALSLKCNNILLHFLAGCQVFFAPVKKNLWSRVIYEIIISKLIFIYYKYLLRTYIYTQLPLIP